MNVKQPLQTYLNAAKKACGVDQKDLMSHSRKRIISDARKIYAHLAYSGGHTLVNIGNHIRKDHSSIIYALRAFKTLSEVDDNFKRLAEQAQENI